MSYTCNFTIEINECPYYKKPNICMSEKTACAFQEQAAKPKEAKNAYVRQPRWYEKFYNNK